MIRRIVLTNYMSHAETVIEPAEGLTVLAGPNNCGKSAVITALQTLCYNERGNFMMRHGASACRVAVETDDGHSIEWERSKKGVRYIIDGREVDRLRGSVPADLHEKLRLPHVESVDGSDDFDIHFGEQKKPIFLLDQNGRQAATFFASSSDAALLVEMQAEHKRDVSEHRADERSLVKDIARCSKQLEPLTPIPEIDSALTILETEYERLTRSLQELGELEACAVRLETQIEQRTEFLSSMQALAFLQTPPKLLDVKPLEQIVTRFDAAQNRRTQENGRQHLLANLVEPPRIEDTTELQSLLEEFNEETTAVARLNEQQAALQTLIDPPAVKDDTVLEELINSLDKESANRQALQLRSAQLDKLVTPPTISDERDLSEALVEIEQATTTLENIERIHTRLTELDEPHTPFATADLAELIANYETALTLSRELNAELQTLDQQRQLAVDGVLKWAAENPTCPTCGAATEPTAWIELKGVDVDVQS